MAPDQRKQQLSATSAGSDRATAKPSWLQARGALELIIAMVLSGTIGVFVVESGVSAATAAWYRCAIGALVMGGYCLLRGYLKSSGYTRRLVVLAALGGVTLVINWVLLFSAYKNTSIGIATVVYHVQPFLLILASALIFRERVSFRQILWVSLGFVGIVFIAQPWSESLTGNFLLGLVQAISAAALYTITVLIAKHVSGVRPQVTVLIQTSVGALILLPLLSWGNLGDALLAGWPWLCGLGVIHTGVMYLLMYSAFPQLSTPVIAVLSFIYPVVALLMDILVFHSKLSASQVLGVMAVLLAGVSLTRKVALTRKAGGVATPRSSQRQRKARR